MRLFFFIGLIIYCYTFNISMAHANSDSWEYQKVQGYKACVKCHDKQVETWEKTKHFEGFKQLTKHKDADEIATNMGVNPKQIKKSPVCAACHFTLGDKNGKPDPISGVSCESCHGPSRDWLEVHNDFGGKGVKRKFESPQHRTERYEKQDKAGMNYPGNIYGFAKNCYRCHLVTNEKLVNVTKHASAVDFDLVERSQGKLRHGAEASKGQLRKIRVVGYAVELEMSLAELANAKPGRYADSLLLRAASAMSNLQSLQQKTNDAQIKAMLDAAGSTAIKSGNVALAKSSEELSALASDFSKQADGESLANIDNHQTIKITSADVPSILNSGAGDSVTVKTEKAPEKSKPVVVEEVKHHTSEPENEIASVSVIKTPKPVSAPGAISKPATTAIESKPAPVTTNPDSKKTSAAGKGLIADFSVKIPKNNLLCSSNNPWMMGAYKLKNNDVVTQADCFALHITTNRDSDVFFFSQSENGKSFQIFPNSCNALGEISNHSIKAEELSVPKNDLQLVAIGFDEEPGEEWLYAVAVSNDEAKQALQELITEIPDVCDTSMNAKFSANLLQRIFKQIAKNHADNFQWQSVKFKHQ